MAKWSAKPISIGHPGFDLAPLAIGPSRMPIVVDTEQARALPELAVLSAHAHGDTDPRTLKAVVEALDSTSENNRAFYYSRIEPVEELEEPTDYEKGWLDVVEGLRGNPGIEVLYLNLGGIDLTAEDSAFEDLEEWEGIKLSPQVRGEYVRFSPLGVQWKGIEPYTVGGEIYLTPLPHRVHEDPPDFSSSWFSDDERAVGAQLRIIDVNAVTGTGSFAALRLQPGVEDPEVWYSDPGFRLWKMDLDYHGYLEALRQTKGAFNWQHLFTDAPLADEEFESTARELWFMLEDLPALFPGHDYTPLYARLAERLR
jgi:hypothetical protein